MLTWNVTYHCKPGQREAFHRELCAIGARETSIGEKGNHKYDYYFDAQDPDVLLLLELWDDQEVLASWLFAQYLVSDAVQLAYAETEGYLPVTLKAQNSEAYRDYVARKGEDNSEHYAVKIEASELLRKHTADTFTTPVFNGSASLRSAAGQLVENVARSARRKEEIGDAYFDKLFSEVSSLYRLDQIGKSEREAQDTSMKALPAESWALLIAIPAIWLVIGAVKLAQRRRERLKAARGAEKSIN